MTTTQKSKPRVDVHLTGDDLRAALRSDAERGLRASPKDIPPKWFYDARGSQLFDDITRLPEYYPTERERTILCLRFGLDGGGERTLEEVAEYFGLTRERIRQIEARAMSKLRHPSADVGARELLEAV